MSMRDWLIVVGLVILLGVVADLIRRYLQRGKLKLAIDKKFTGMPEIDVSSELPNGGARVVGSADSADSKSNTAPSPTAKARTEPSFEPAPAPLATASSTTPMTGAVSSVAADAEPRRMIIDDALMTSPAVSGDSTDEEVDLLLEREFKGVGQGADDWLGESRVVSEPRAVVVEQPPEAKTAAEIEVEPEPEPESESELRAETAESVDQVEFATQSPSNELEEPLAADESSTGDPLAESGIDAQPVAVSLVQDDAPALDLERPVHELLVHQQSAVQGELAHSDAASPVDSNVDAAAATVAVQAETAPLEGSESVAKTKAKAKAKPKPKSKTASAKRSEPRPEEQPSFFDLHPDLAPEIEPVVEKPKSRRRKKPKQAAPSISHEPEETPLEQQVLVINVLAKTQPFSGQVLFQLIRACGLEFGSKMSIYHRYEGDDGQGALQFSMANAIAPGTFDPANADQFSTPAITFFLQLADPTDRMNAFECMLATAQCVADNLNGELKDENRSSLRTQTIEHYRQKVREFERKQLTRRV